MRVVYLSLTPMNALEQSSLKKPVRRFWAGSAESGWPSPTDSRRRGRLRLPAAAIWPIFRTPLNTRVLDIPARISSIIGRTPMSRVGNVDELVGCAIFLASDASSFVTGQTIPVDGGFLAKGI